MGKLRDYIVIHDFLPNVALVNGYILPDHHVGYHRDSIGMVATVSLGGSRRFWFREYENHNNTIQTVLNDGEMNTKYEHSILKQTLHADRRPRYSVTSRIIDHLLYQNLDIIYLF